MARALIWATLRSKENGGAFLKVNIGSDDFNFKVLDLANEVANKVKGTEISINSEAQPDKRSYAVDFSKFRSLAPNFQPLLTLSDSIDRLIVGLEGSNLLIQSIRNSEYVRLNKLRQHMMSGRLDQNLRWKI